MLQMRATAVVIGALAVVCVSGAAPAQETTYRDKVAALDKRRVKLAKERADADTSSKKNKVLDRSSKSALRAIREDIIPAWKGTAWDYNGTTTEPREGHIACGYFVTTVLVDAGFKVERRKLAQQASEWIVRTLADEDSIWRYRKGDEDAVVTSIEGEGEGLYVVGLDNHVGFLLHDGEDVEFCHSSYLEPAKVVCEDPRSAPAFESNYHVVGKILGRSMMTAWLEGSAIKTKVPDAQ